jgi:PDZ domain-containing secreted protein
MGPPVAENLFWSILWALTHLIGVVVTVVLRRRSGQQLRVARGWQAAAAPGERQEALDLVEVTRDRHRRNGALVITAVSYFALGVMVVSFVISPWLSLETYVVVNRVILTIGEWIWIGSAWMSVRVGDRITSDKAAPEQDEGGTR